MVTKSYPHTSPRVTPEVWTFDNFYAILKIPEEIGSLGVSVGLTFPF